MTSQVGKCRRVPPCAKQTAVAQGGAHRAGIASGGLLLDCSSDFSVLSTVERNVIAAREAVAFEFRRQRGAGHRGENWNNWEKLLREFTVRRRKSQPRGSCRVIRFLLCPFLCPPYIGNGDKWYSTARMEAARNSII